MRKFIIAGNWKMFKNPQQAKAFFEELKPLVQTDLQKQIVVFPSTLCLPAVQEASKGTGVFFGAQNCYFEAEGAFTGETSPRTLKEIGATFVLVGHSERRTLFGEKDDLLAKKVKSAQEFELVPMLCVGETLKEREEGQTGEVIRKQLQIGLSLANLDGDFMVAYEPVWAIGTGKVALPQQAEDAHRFLRASLHEIAGEKVAAKTCFLYGGSVKPDNARELGLQPNIDGFLIGGASLKPSDFASIAKLSR